MTAKERVLTVRLTEKLQKHPAYAKALGVEAAGAKTDRNKTKGLTGV